LWQYGKGKGIDAQRRTWLEDLQASKRERLEDGCIYACVKNFGINVHELG